MKSFLATLLFLAIAAVMFLSGCSSYDSMPSTSGFTQQDLELQRKNADRARGF